MKYVMDAASRPNLPGAIDAGKPFPISLSKDHTMNTMLTLGGSMPFLREVDGFMSFSKLNKADGILRTGIQTHVGNQRGVQKAVRQLAEVTFPASFDPIRDNTWKNTAQKLLIEKVGQEYVIRFYDTDRGFEADCRVNP